MVSIIHVFDTISRQHQAYHGGRGKSSINDTLSPICGPHTRRRAGGYSLGTIVCLVLSAAIRIWILAPLLYSPAKEKRRPAAAFLILKPRWLCLNLQRRPFSLQERYGSVQTTFTSGTCQGKVGERPHPVRLRVCAGIRQFSSSGIGPSRVRFALQPLTAQPGRALWQLRQRHPIVWHPTTPSQFLIIGLSGRRLT